MPISKPDHVQVQRLEFGKSVSTKIDKVIQQQERNIWLDAIPSISFGAIGIGASLAGYGILSWAGMKVSDIVDDTKSEFDKLTNKMSDSIVNAVSTDITLSYDPQTGEVEASGGVFYVERRNAEILSDTEYLRPIQAELHSQMPVLCSQASDHFSRPACDALQAELMLTIDITDSQFWENAQMINFEILNPSKTNFSSHYISSVIRGRKISYVDPTYIRTIDPSY